MRGRRIAAVIAALLLSQPAMGQESTSFDASKVTHAGAKGVGVSISHRTGSSSAGGPSGRAPSEEGSRDRGDSLPSCVPMYSSGPGVPVDQRVLEGSGDCIVRVMLAPYPTRDRGETGQPTGPRPDVQPSPEQVALILFDRARALAAMPPLQIAPSRWGLTGLESYFWLARPPRPIVATAGVRGLTVTAEARPVQYVWEFGDGRELTTSHPGRRWTLAHPGDIGHLYETAATYAVAVDVIWAARWRVSGGAWQPLGYFTTTDSRDYRVREVIAVLTRTS